jgi:uncharacterized protein YndB with AHSA1/START domain
MAEIVHEIKIAAPASKIFTALTTQDGLEAWHTARIEGTPQLNAIITFEATDKPLFRWKIVKWDPDKKLVWECVEGPGDSVGTQAIYTLAPTEDSGRTVVGLSHTSWPHEQGNFHKCNTLWGVLLHHLKKYAETGKAEPAIH